MQAETLNCPTCGAAVSSSASNCQFCDAKLATVACPGCFAMMFVGSKHCSRCGARATDAQAIDAASRKCPRCRIELNAIAVGSASLRTCGRCDGMWVDVASFEQICNEREQQSVVLGVASEVPKQRSGLQSKVRYVPCPDCGQLMNRVNFARCSGVVVDVCKGHGTWFDSEELSQIIEFIRGGGMNEARAREKRDLEDDRQRFRQEQLSAALQSRRMGSSGDLESDRASVVSAARELLGLLVG